MEIKKKCLGLRGVPVGKTTLRCEKSTVSRQLDAKQ